MNAPARFSDPALPPASGSVTSQTWLAQPRTLLASVCSASESGSRVRPRSMI